MKHKILMTLVLLLTAVGGAWAEDYTTVFELNGSKANVGNLTLGTSSVETGSVKIHVNTDEIAGIQINADYDYEGGRYFTIAPETGSFKKGDKLSIAVCFSNSYDKSVKAVIYADDHGTLLYTTANGINGLTAKDDPVVEEYVLTQDASVLYIGGNSNDYTFVTTLKVERPASAEPAIEVTTDAASEQDVFTTASFTMPAYDVTVNYTLVRDMQDATSPVAFSGIPTGDGLTVKKGSDGKYKFGTDPTFKLTDPLADNADIIAADGITVKVEKQGVGETWTAGTLTDFLTDAQPGTYRLKAMPTDENSPYDGTVYSSEFTVVEQYDLTLQPADEYSIGKLDKVIVGSGTEATEITPDATTGEATREGIDPGTEVKLKAKKGYIIEEVKVKKGGAAPTLSLTSPAMGQVIGSDGKNYAAASVPSGVDKVAMIAYVSGSNGLAIALADESEKMNWATAKSTCEAKTPVFSNGTWEVPSQDDWKNMFKANGNSDSSYTGLNNAITNAGGAALQEVSSYRSSTEEEGNSGGAYYVSLRNGGASWYTNGKGGNFLFRAVLTW